MQSKLVRELWNWLSAWSKFNICNIQGMLSCMSLVVFSALCNITPRSNKPYTWRVCYARRWWLHMDSARSKARPIQMTPYAIQLAPWQAYAVPIVSPGRPWSRPRCIFRAVRSVPMPCGGLCVNKWRVIWGVNVWSALKASWLAWANIRLSTPESAGPSLL